MKRFYSFSLKIYWKMWKQISLATHCMHFVWSRERETGDWQRGEGEHFIAKASHAFEAQQQGDLRSIAIKMIYYWSSWSTLIFNFFTIIISNREYDFTSDKPRYLRKQNLKRTTILASRKVKCLYLLQELYSRGRFSEGMGAIERGRDPIRF